MRRIAVFAAVAVLAGVPVAAAPARNGVRMSAAATTPCLSPGADDGDDAEEVPGPHGTLPDDGEGFPMPSPPSTEPSSPEEDDLPSEPAAVERPATPPTPPPSAL